MSTLELPNEVSQAADDLMYMKEAQIPEEELTLLLALMKKPKNKKRKPEANQNHIKKVTKQRLTIEGKEKFTEETLKLIETWYKAETDPLQVIVGGVQVAGEFSIPMKKQVTNSDVKPDQSRLLLLKQVENTMLPMLEETENPKDGLDVSVYGPNEKVHRMKFKLWNTDKTLVLTTGWKKFVTAHGLEEHCQFLTVWMFRHITTREICFAIKVDKFDFEDQPCG